MTADDRSAALGAPEAATLGDARGPQDDGLELQAPTVRGRGRVPGAQSLRNLWQVPAIVVSAALIGWALLIASNRAPENDFDGVLDTTQALIVTGDLDAAAEIIENTLMPNLDVAEPVHRGRFHALAADWVAATQEQAGTPLTEFNERIVDQYTLAEQFGAPMGVLRRLRWGHALLDLGRAEEARVQLDALDGLTGSPEQGPDAERAHNELLRRLVEASIADPPATTSDEAFAGSRARADFERNMELLAAYRDNGRIGIADEAWAVAREAELRLGIAEFVEAIERLQVDMRRLEHRVELEGDGEFDSIHALEPWGELYTLLGRAWLESGSIESAEHYFEVALERFEAGDARRRDAQLQLAIIDRGRGRPEVAVERLDAVIGPNVLDHTNEPWFLQALLTRAELLSLLARHDESIADFTHLVQLMGEGRPTGRVTRDETSNVLVDRLESALMHGDLDLGLRYVTLAEDLFERGDVPENVLERIAITNRQIADNIMDQGRAGLGEHEHRIDLVPTALRAAANERYLQAGRYFERYARHPEVAVGRGHSTEAEALWRAGDSFDLGGDLDGAILAFRDFDGGFRPHPLWPEVAYRLGLAHRARGDVQAAAAAFRAVIDERETTTFGTKALVPYAECLIDLGEVAEAEDHLVRVVDGRTTDPDEYGDPGRLVIEPASRDYVEALLALGRLYHDRGDPALDDQVKAIERLDAAVKRLTGDPRLEEAEFRLADAHRQAAGRLDALLGPGGSRLSPAERNRAGAAREEHLQRAMDLFGLAVEGYARIQPRSMLDAQQRDFERNATLYRADCAFDLGLVDRSIQLYDEAARRYFDQYASMHALVQMVNCYVRQGDLGRAGIAHDKAMKRLEQLPDAAFSDPRAIMDRAAWEEWLRNMPIAMTQGAGTDRGGTP